jgi:hypothetical protein
MRAETMGTKGFPSFLFPGLPHQFLDAWFLNERMIVEAPATRQRKMSGTEGTYRLTAGPYGHGRALLFAGCHMRRG